MVNIGGFWIIILVGLLGLIIIFIVVDFDDVSNVWVIFGGYIVGEKVYEFIDVGVIWINVLGVLLNILVLSIVY